MVVVVVVVEVVVVVVVVALVHNYILNHLYLYIQRPLS
jgi:hypothetical protein